MSKQCLHHKEYYACNVCGPFNPPDQPNCQCRYPNSCETCWPSVTQAQIDAAVTPPDQPKGTSAREWTLHAIKENTGAWLNRIVGPTLPDGTVDVIEKSAYDSVCNERDARKASQQNLVYQRDSALADLEAVKVELEERRMATPAMNAVHILSQRIAELERERDRLKSALSKIDSIEDWAGGTDLELLNTMAEVARGALRG